MPVLQISTAIAAPVERCFDLARDIVFHVRSLQHTGERAVSGVTHGLIGAGESVTWQAKHLGVTQRLTSQITAFEAPHYFQDTMTQGAFKHFRHDHYFEPVADGTMMRDVIDFSSPLGPLGWVLDRVFMARYLGRLITERGEAIRLEAEKHASQPRA